MTAMPRPTKLCFIDQQKPAVNRRQARLERCGIFARNVLQLAAQKEARTAATIARKQGLENRRSSSRFESLPIDIHNEIFSYLVGLLSCYTQNSRPQEEDELYSLYNLDDKREVLERHPFYQIALSSRGLRERVGAFCHLLTSCESILGFRIPENSKSHSAWKIRINERLEAEREARKVLGPTVDAPYRLMWVTWTFHRCMHYRKRSQRRGTWDYLTWVCQKCDKSVRSKVVSDFFICCVLQSPCGSPKIKSRTWIESKTQPVHGIWRRLALKKVLSRFSVTSKIGRFDL